MPAITAKAAPRPPSPMPEEILAATEVPELVRIPSRRVLAVDGEGPPEEPQFQAAVEAIYRAAYRLKFAQKARGHDFKVAPLEGRWFGGCERKDWKWQLRMAVPERIRVGDFDGARLQYVEPMTVMRILHRGPYADEKASLDKARNALLETGLTPRGAHVEIYLNDPRRTRPEKLKTVLLVEPA